MKNIAPFLGILFLSLSGLPARAAPGDPDAGLPPGTAVLVVSAPEGARLMLDGVDQGERRRFEARGLEDGRRVEHEVHVRFADGQEARRTIFLQAGWLVRAVIRPPRTAAPESVDQTGHTGPLAAVVTSPDGKYRVTASWDRTAKLWDVATDQLLRTFKGHTDRLTSAAFSPDSRRVLTGSLDRTARLWDVRADEALLTLSSQQDGPVTAVAFSPDGEQLLTEGARRTVVLWDARTGQPVRTLPLAAKFVVYSPDGRALLLPAADGARLTDPRTGQVLTSFREDPKPPGARRILVGRPLAVAFSPDGSQVVVGFAEGARAFDVKTGRAGRTFPEPQHVTDLAFSPDGRRLLLAAIAGDVLAYDAVTGQRLCSYTGRELLLSSVAYSADGRQVLIRRENDRLTRVLDARTGRHLCTFRGSTAGVPSLADGPGAGGGLTLEYASDGRPVRVDREKATVSGIDARSGQILKNPVGHARPSGHVAFSPDGKQILVRSDDLSFSYALWDVRRGTLAGTSHTDRAVLAVAFSPDGKQVLTGSTEPLLVTSLQLWDAPTGRPLREHKSYGRFALLALAFRPDGKQVLVGTDELMARTWDPDPQPGQGPAWAHADAITAVAYRPDGRQWVTGSLDGTAVIGDAETGKAVHTLRGHTRGLTAVAYRGDGRRLLTASWDATALIWDAETGQPLRTLRGHRDVVTAVAFAADGTHALTASADGTATVWDAESGRPLRTLRGHASGLSSLALSPDGLHAVTGSGDRTAIIWDTKTGRALHTLRGHTAGVTSVAYGPDGSAVLTGSLDGTARSWDARTGQPLRTFAPPAGPPRGQDPAAATDSFDRTALAWNLATPHQVTRHEVWRSAGVPDAAKHLDDRFARAAALAFSPDRTSVLLSDGGTSPGLWEVQTGKLLRSFTGHTDRVSSVAYRPDGRLVLTGSHDGTVRLWDVATGEELARLTHLNGSRDWAVVTPDGLFDGSRNGRETVTYREGRDLAVVPLDRFFQDFYYPGLLSELGRGERPTAGQELRPRRTPLVRLLADSGPDGAKDRVTVEVTATDQGDGVRGPWLLHNGSAIRAEGQTRRDGRRVHGRFVVPLVLGENRIEARAATADGAQEGEPARLVLRYDGALPDPELAVIVFGINRHAPGAGVSGLDFCVPDARRMADLFRRRAPQRYRQVHVTELLDEQATRERIRQAIADVARKARPQDTLVLYFAGHGLTVGQRFYLIPYDFKAPAGPPEEAGGGAVGVRAAADAVTAAVRRSGLAIDELGEALAEVPALRRVLIFDTCHSGSTVPLADRDRTPFAFRGEFERLDRAQGVYVLAAAAANELAAESRDLGHSILTYALLAGLGEVTHGPLRQAPAPAAAELDVLDWFRFAQRHVPALYERYVGRAQHVALSGDDRPGFPLLRGDGK